MNNIAAGYFTQYHGLSPAVSGVFASCFGLMNICMRSLGGILSDVSNKKWGMRGRLWSTWLIQVRVRARARVRARVRVRVRV